MKHVNELQQNLEQLAEQFEHLDISGQMILPANTEDREQFSLDDSSEEGDYDTEDEEDRLFTTFEHILKVVSTIKHATIETDEDEQDEAEREGPEGNDENQAQQTQPDQQPEWIQMETDSEHDSLPPLEDERKFEVFGDKTDQTSCDLTKKSFTTSICKVLPDTAEFPEDTFNIEGCVWCGSKGHDVYNCLGYATWLGDIWLGTIEERRLPYPKRQKRIEEMLKAAKDQHHNPRRPWELYVGHDDEEYLTEKGVKIQIRDMKIVNLIPRHLQTTTTIYADLPTAHEMSRMLQLSTTIQSSAQLTVMEEVCN